MPYYRIIIINLKLTFLILIYFYKDFGGLCNKFSKLGLKTIKKEMLLRFRRTLCTFIR